MVFVCINSTKEGSDRYTCEAKNDMIINGAASLAMHLTFFTQKLKEMKNNTAVKVKAALYREFISPFMTKKIK
jgi:hypothetical protein